MPIQYALTYPERAASNEVALDGPGCGALILKGVHTAISLFAPAREALRKKSARILRFNAADEVAVEAFLDRRLSFGGMEIIGMPAAWSPSEDVGDRASRAGMHPMISHSPEGQPAIEKCFDSDFVRSVEGAGIRAFLAQRFAGQAQTRKSPLDTFSKSRRAAWSNRGHFIGCSPLRVG